MDPTQLHVTRVELLAEEIRLRLPVISLCSHGVHRHQLLAQHLALTLVTLKLKLQGAHNRVALLCFESHCRLQLTHH